MISERDLKRAIEIVIEDTSNIEIDHAHVFSDEFEKRMAKLIRKKRFSLDFLTGTTWKKLAVSMVTILVVSSTMVFNVGALSDRGFEFIEKVFLKYSEVHFEQIRELPPATEFVPIEFGYIPKGFELVEEITDKDVPFQNAFYQKGDEYIVFDLIPVKGSAFIHNTEGTTIETLYINQLEVQYYANRGTQTIFWNDNLCVYTVATTLCKDEAIKLVKSLKMKGN